MLAFDFTHYYKNSDIRDIYKPCYMNISGLRCVNKRFNDKEKNLVETFSKKSVKNVFFYKLY